MASCTLWLSNRNNSSSTASILVRRASRTPEILPASVYLSAMTTLKLPHKRDQCFHSLYWHGIIQRHPDTATATVAGKAVQASFTRLPYKKAATTHAGINQKPRSFATAFQAAPLPGKKTRHQARHTAALTFPCYEPSMGGKPPLLLYPFQHQLHYIPGHQHRGIVQ